MNLKAIIFDFDGVIINGNTIKHNAYYTIFQDEPELVARLDAVLQTPIAKKPRRVVVATVVEQATQAGYTPKKSQADYVTAYGQETYSALVAADKIPGALESLRELSKDYSLFVNTAAPDDAISTIAEAQNVTQYFTEIFGSTDRDKTENVRYILKKYNLTADECIFVGDGFSDQDAAQETGIVFVGITNEYNSFVKDDSIAYKLPDLVGLVDLVCKLSTS